MTTPEVLRVTEPGTEAMSLSAGKKNPKKVAAGRAGAAAKKAKHDKLLEELRAAKESLRGPKPMEVDVPPPSVPKEEQTCDMSDSSVPSTGSMVPWIIGVAGLLGLAFILKSTNLLAPSPQVLPRTKSTGSAQQLKVPRNPFYME